MDPSVSADLEFDKVLKLIAAHARTGVGRAVIGRIADHLGDGEDLVRQGRLTSGVLRLLEEDGPITFAGVDEALPWLEPSAPAPFDPRDLFSLLNLARRISSLRRRLAASGDRIFEAVLIELPDTSALIDEVAPKLGRDGTVPDSASPELARCRRAMARLRGEVLGELESVRRAHPNVVTDAPPTLRRDRYCIPVLSSAKSRLPGLLLDTSSRGATSFIEPFSAVDLNNGLAEAVAGEREEIRRIMAGVARAFAAARDDLVSGVEVLSELDAAQAKALFGRVADARMVISGEGPELILRGARHPLLDERLYGLRVEVFGTSERRDPDHRVVPLDFRLPEGARTLVVSGPNAGGKTIVLKTLGLMVLMSMHGIPLPVEEGTAIPRFDKLWCHIGDEQDVASDLSTFSGTMAATSRLLQGADADTLILFDELGAGTDPLEGAALGCALLEDLTRRSCVTVVSTHLAAIALSAASSDGMDNAAMDYSEASERPTYVLSIGRPGRSRGLEIARRMGVTENVLERAIDLLGGDHLELDRWLSRLETAERELANERAELCGRQAALEKLYQKTAEESERLENERRKLPEILAEERDKLRRRAKKQLDDVIVRLEAAREKHEAIGRRRLQKLRDEALQFEEPEMERPTTDPNELVEGAEVRLAFGARGILREVRGGQCSVMVGSKRLWVPVSDLDVVASPKPVPRVAEVRVEAAEERPRELNLIGLDSESARTELERFFDQAMTAGLPRVRVVHGHGTGTLRRMVADVCRSHPAVCSFRHPLQQFGGSGATEVEIEASG